MEWIFRILYIYLFLGSAADCLRPGPGGPTPPPPEFSVRGLTSSSGSETTPASGVKRRSGASLKGHGSFEVIREGLPALRLKFRRLHPVVSSPPQLPPSPPGPRREKALWRPIGSLGLPESSSQATPLPQAPPPGPTPPWICSRIVWRRAPSFLMASPASPWTPPPGTSMGQAMRVS